METYSEFASRLYSEYKIIQQDFILKYDLESYSDWFYDDSTSILTLSNDKNKINFIYYPVGSYSFKSNSWLWAWDNTYSIHNNKLITTHVKEFGIENNFDELINSHFETNELKGWELTAISFNFIEALGGYKIKNSDNLDLYFLIIEQIEDKDLEEVKRVNKIKSDELINCDTHGKTRRAFICQHIFENEKNGFEESFETYIGMKLYEDDDLCAWCNECEKIRLIDDEWNDENMELVKLKMVCENCYFEFKDAIL